MTTHRDLKRLVRERAARTGESYTTARRTVLARAGKPGYDTFGGGDHHESTLLAHLLRQAGHAYTEATLCGLAGGVGFLYTVFAYTGHPPILTIVAQHHPDPWAQSALDRLGIGYEVRHSTGPGPARRDLDALLDAGRPVLCTVGRSGLPWHQPARGLDTDPYRVIVAGRSGDDYLVDDLADQPHVVAADVFMAAWSAHRKGRHERLVISPSAGSASPASVSPGSASPAPASPASVSPGPASSAPADLAVALRAAIATTVAHLTGPVLGNAFDVNMGFSGMGRLLADLRDDRTKRGWRRRFAEPGELAFALQRLYECLTLEYTAPGGTRPLYATFLDEAAEVLGDTRISRAAALFRTAGENWTAMADTALAACHPAGEILERRLFAQLTGAPVPPLPTPADLAGPDNAGELLQKLAGLVEEAMRAEKAAVDLLRA